jgi:predicted RNA binding protein YcfA (HicA-like mRNA interferase family)
MSPKVRRMDARTVERLLVRHGFVLVHQSGSHRKWWHPEKHLTTIVPMHPGKDLPTGTLLQIVRAAGIPENEWRG